MKKLRIFIVFIMLVCYPTFSYAQIYKQADIGNGSYIIGTYLFNKEKTATYNGTLTTPMIMMASKTITGNDLTNKKIYFKNSRGKWINAITGQSESNIPSTFEITCVNMNCQNNISPVIDSYDTYKNSDIVNGAYIIGTHIFNKDKNDVYNGTLTTPMIMLASKTITGNALSDMNIYFKNSRGKWISAITGKIIDSVPSNFNISHINLNKTESKDKATDTITVTTKTSNYTGSGIQPTVKTTSGLTATLTYYSDSSCATKTTTSNAVSTGGAPKNVGTYYVKATTTGNADYNASSLGCTKAVVINKANATCPTLTEYSGTYDGTAKKITVSGGKGGTIQYRTSTTGTWTTTKPTRTGVGTTTVYVQVLGDSNHNTISCGSKTILVKQKLILDKTEETLTIGDRFKVTPTMYPMQEIVYTAGTPSVASVDGDGIITAHAGGVSTITAKASNGETAQIKIIVQNPNLILEHGYLKTSLVNNVPKIVNQNGTIITLRGYNVGAWLSRSFSMSAVKELANSQEEFDNLGYSCINNIAFKEALRDNPNIPDENKSGDTEDEIDEIDMIWYNSFMQEMDWDLIAQSGANVIRLPIEYSLFDNLGDAKAFALIDKAIEECKNRGIYVIIDLHLAPGRQNGGGYCGTPKFFGNEQYFEQMLSFWEKISYRYALNPVVAGYDLLNEPEAVYEDKEGNIQNYKEELLYFYVRAYQKIRNMENARAQKEGVEAKHHIIIMEQDCVFCGYESSGRSTSIGFLPDPSNVEYTYTDENGVKQTGNTTWTNVMYSTHDYFSRKNYECYSSNGAKEPVIDGDSCASPVILRDRFLQKLKLIEIDMKDKKVPYYIGEFSYLGDSYNKNSSEFAIIYTAKKILKYTTNIETSPGKDQYKLILSGDREQYLEYLLGWQYAMEKYDEIGLHYTTWTYKANHEPYFGTIYYSTRKNLVSSNSNLNGKGYTKADLLNDDYETLKQKFSLKTSEYMRFNYDLYTIFANHFGGRVAKSIDLTDVSNSTINMNVGETEILNYIVKPSNTIQKQATWEVIDETDENGNIVNGNIVKVDQNTGKITAVGKGSATIKATVYPIKNLEENQKQKNTIDVIDDSDFNINIYHTDAFGDIIYPSVTITVTVE